MRRDSSTICGGVPSRGSATKTANTSGAKKVEATEENADRRKAEIGRLEAEYPFVMIMRENKPRKAFILERGQYDAPGEEGSTGA